MNADIQRITYALDPTVFTADRKGCLVPLVPAAAVAYRAREALLALREPSAAMREHMSWDDIQVWQRVIDRILEDGA